MRPALCIVYLKNEGARTWAGSRWTLGTWLGSEAHTHGGETAFQTPHQPDPALKRRLIQGP